MTKIAMTELQRAAVAAGDAQALLLAVAQTACLWIELGGCHRRLWRSLGAAHAVADASGKGALLAAGLDMLALLDSSSHGRQALRQLGLEPVEKDVEGPRGGGR